MRVYTVAIANPNPDPNHNPIITEVTLTRKFDYSMPTPIKVNFCTMYVYIVMVNV